MAEDKHAADAPEAAPKNKSPLVKFIVIGLIASLVTAGGLFGAFLVFGEHPPQADSADENAEDGSGEGDTKKKKKKKKKKSDSESAPTYMKLENLTVNLGGGRDRFLALSLEIKIAEPAAQKLLTDRMPEVKNLILMTLSAHTPEELGTVDGKTALAQKLRDDLNALIDEDEDTGVADIFFTQFIIQ